MHGQFTRHHLPAEKRKPLQIHEKQKSDVLEDSADKVINGNLVRYFLQGSLN